MQPPLWIDVLRQAPGRGCADANIASIPAGVQGLRVEHDGRIPALHDELIDPARARGAHLPWLGMYLGEAVVRDQARIHADLQPAARGRVENGEAPFVRCFHACEALVLEPYAIAFEANVRERTVTEHAGRAREDRERDGEPARTLDQPFATLKIPGHDPMLGLPRARRL